MRATLLRNQGFQVGKENDAFLFVGVGAGDEGDAGGGGAGVIRKMGDVGGDVEVVAWLDDGVVFEVGAVPAMGRAAECVNGGFMRGVLMGFGAAAGRDGDDLQMDASRAGGFGGNANRVGEALYANVCFAALHDAAGGLRRFDCVVHGGLALSAC